ncbi:hypothetical protein [Lachnoclostridium sp.]|uniref:hypothetical protein n=1 Tax=Lachnoclostridium sp. TaxID=2028282 RepID=UPI002896B104|nr:hypothetical protein [Lachnoclostridium sp.]
MENKVLMKRIINMEIQNNSDILRFDMYSVITYMILSKEVFRNNKEIIEFLEKINLSFKPYVFKSRTILLGKIIRYIEVADRENLLKMLSGVRKQLELSVDENEAHNVELSKNKNNKGNYMSELSKRYSRNG